MFAKCLLKPYEGQIRYLPKAFGRFLVNPEFAVNVYVQMILLTKGIRSQLLSWRLQKKYSVYFSASAQGGENLSLSHYVGTGIAGIKIGKNCVIYQNVTLGKRNGVGPVLGDNVVIFAGAKVIGGVKIGDHAVIGANSVVVKDVPDNAIVAGVPAKVLRYRSLEDDIF